MDTDTTPKGIKASYIPIAWFNKYLEKMKQISLSKINRSVVKQYQLAPPGNESKLVSFLKFMGIIDDNYSVIEERKKELRMEGDVFHQALSKILQKAYYELFATLDLTRVNAIDLRNYFKGKYAYSDRQAQAAAILFASLTGLAKISVSEDIAKLDKSSSTYNGKTTGKISENKPVRQPVKEETTPKIFQRSVYDMLKSENRGQPENEEYYITVRGENVSMTSTLKSEEDLNRLIGTLKINCKFTKKKLHTDKGSVRE